MTLKIEVATDKDATSWTDVTDKVDIETFRFAGSANRCEIDTGSGFDFDNDAGSVDIPIRRVVRVTEDATTPTTTLFHGRVIAVGKARGSYRTEPANELDVSLVDHNADFGGIRITRTGRPAGPDHERVRYMLETWMQGVPRASTDIADTYLQSTDPIALPAATFDDAKPIDIIADALSQTGKEGFITVDSELFYGPSDSLVYAASLSITDVDPDYSTSFPPDLASTGNGDGTEYFSGVRIVGKDRQQWEYIRSASEALHDHWRTSLSDDSIDTEAKAAARADIFLDAVDHVEDQYRCTLLLRDDQVDLIKYGQTVSFRSAACGVLTPVTLRVKRLEWEHAAPGRYFAHLELGFPAKLESRVGPGGLTAPGNTPGGGGGGKGDCGCGPAPFEGCDPVTVDYTVSAEAGDFACVIPPGDPSAPLGCRSDDTPGEGTILLYDSCHYRVQYVVDHGPNSNRLSVQVAGVGGFPVLGITQMGSLREGTNFSIAEAFIDTPIGSGSDYYVVWLQDVTYMWRDSAGASVSAVVTYVSGPDPRFEDLAGDCTALPAHGQPVVHEGIAGETVGTTMTVNHPYLPGSLWVFVTGVRVIPSEIDPTAGTFSLPFDTIGLVVVASYLGAGAAAGTGANNPRSAMAHTYVTPLLLGSGSDGAGNKVLHDDNTWRPITGSDIGDAEPPDRALAGFAVKLSTPSLPTLVQVKAAIGGTSGESPLTSITLDSAPTAGNLLIIDLGNRLASVAATTLSLRFYDAGWALIVGNDFSGVGSEGHGLYAKVSDGTETTVTFQQAPTAAGASLPEAAILTEWSGFGGAVPAMDTSDVADVTNDATPDVPAITPTAAAMLLLASVWKQPDGPNPGPATISGYTIAGDTTYHGSAGRHRLSLWYNIETPASGTYGPFTLTNSGDGTDDSNLIHLALALGASVWVIPVPEATDDDDATYELIAGADVLRIGLGARYRVVRSRLRIACETAGSRTYVIKGANLIDFSDEVTLATVTFTATGSYTPQDVEFLWIPPDRFEFYELSGTSENRRIHAWELYEASATEVIVTDPTTGDAAELQDALDNIEAAGAGVTDHGALTGLADFDHDQYVRGTHGGLETFQAHGATGSTEAIDLANGNYHAATLDADCTFTFTGQTTGKVCSFTLELKEDGTGGWDPTWPGTVIWPGGAAPTHDTTAGSVTFYVFHTIDNGTTWYGFPVGADSGSGGTPASTVESETAFGISPAAGTATEYARGDHTHGSPPTPAGSLIPVDTGTPTYDDSGDNVEVSVATAWGFDGVDPYYDSAGAVAGEEAALYWDPDNTTYVLVPFDF